MIVEVPLFFDLLNLFYKEFVIVESLSQLRFKGVDEIGKLGLSLLVDVVSRLLKGRKGI